MKTKMKMKMKMKKKIRNQKIYRSQLSHTESQSEIGTLNRDSKSRLKIAAWNRQPEWQSHDLLFWSFAPLSSGRKKSSSYINIINYPLTIALNMVSVLWCTKSVIKKSMDLCGLVWTRVDLDGLVWTSKVTLRFKLRSSNRWCSLKTVLW